MRITLAACFAFLVGVQSVSAGDWRPAKSNPYSKLFQPVPLAPLVPLAALAAVKAEAPKPREACETSVAPTDPRLDARLRAELEKKDTRYTMRIVPPPVCK